MPKSKVAITIDADLLREVDHWVRTGTFPNRSQAIQAGLVRLREEHARRHSLLAELAQLDPVEERALAEEQFRQAGRAPAAASRRFASW
jgi:Arc/MetJ-type ribon-helix-helix transcriptional regulator